MGNAVGCVSAGVKAPKKASSYAFNPFPLFSSFHGRPRNALQSSSSSSRNKKQKRERIQVDEGSVITSEKALPAAALPFHSDQTSSSIPFSRSTSVVHPSLGSKKQSFQRSSSARRRSNNDPLIIRPHQLVNQEVSSIFVVVSFYDKELTPKNYKEPKIESPETSHFVLVHGGGFGAWCWYKTMTLLKESGFKVDAVDLTGSGVSSSDTNSITSLEQYVKPLIDTFNELGNEEKVILVGHDFGGACISYVMELFPSKVAKAVFIAATMLTSGQSALDTFSQQMGSNDLMQQAQIFLYANGKQNPPTSIDLDRTLLRDLLFNQSAAKDVELALISMRPIPFAPVLEKLSVSDDNYGSVPRFYIKTLQDCAIPVSVQEAMINSNPPELVFEIKGSDHAPFFSKPRALHRILVEISKITPR